jgi:hypothetical protein
MSEEDKDITEAEAYGKLWYQIFGDNRPPHNRG